MTNNEIVEALARKKVVEAIARNVCRRSPAELSDLCQFVYLMLLRMPEGKLSRIEAEKGLENYVAGIVKKQWYSTEREYYRLYRDFSRRTDELNNNTHEKTDNE